MSDLESVQPRPIKIMDPVLIKIRADEKVIKNTKTGKVTMVVKVIHVLVKPNVIHLMIKQKLVLKRPC